jgi:methyl-accepting chemotaxis protein
MTPANPDTPIDELDRPIYTSLPNQHKYQHLPSLPIAWRLTLGFLSAALIAVSIVGVAGLQRTTSLSSQSNFYQSLLQTNATLANCTTLLQLMMSKTNEALAVATNQNPSQEDLSTTLDAVHTLINRYDNTINSYSTQDILSNHPEQMALLSAAGQSSQVNQQHTLANSAVRMWKVYHDIQERVLQFIVAGNVQAAQYTQQFQAEPTNADALNAVNSLIKFNVRLAATVEDVENVEVQHTLIITIVAAILAFLIITSIGIFTSRTLVLRLNQLLRVIQAVEHGDGSARVAVIGHDEIGQVSASTNTLLETIGGLQEETRQQYNALVNAAETLFADTKLVSIDDLRMGTTMSEDPIRMLASALNFTIERLRRFAQRTQSVAEQLDAISHRELEHAKSLMRVITQKQGNEAEMFDVDLAVSPPQVPPPSSKEIQDQIITMQHMSTQLAQEIIYLANQLVSLSQDLKQSSASLQANVMGKREQGELPHDTFSDLFSKPGVDTYSPVTSSILDIVKEIPKAREE